MKTATSSIFTLLLVLMKIAGFYYVLFVFIPRFSTTCDNVTEWLLGETTNLTTSGELKPDLYRIDIDHNDPPSAIRVVVSSINATVKNPLTVTVVRGKSVLNVALPRIQPHRDRNFPYWFTSDTMCDDDRSLEQLRQPVYISVASSVPSNVSLKVKKVADFVIKDQAITTKSSPSEPRYYLYVFPDGVDKVFLKATSTSDTCAKIMARRANCPAFDSVGLAEYSDVYFYQSFTTFGGFYVKKSDIGPAFHIIFSVSPDDSVCGTKTDISANPARIKKVEINVTPISDEYMLPLLPLIVYLTSVLIVLGITYLHCEWLDKQENNEPDILEGNDSEATVFVDKIWLFDKPAMTVSHKQYEKQKLVRESKYFNFLYFQIFGSLLPALTTLFQNQKKTYRRMHLDNCHFNFLCSLEFLTFKSFNGMASASSLIIIGVVNLIIVFRKAIFRGEVPKMPTTHGIQKRDAPKVVVLLSVVALGILWTVSSNCPHQTTSHLYVYTMIWFFLSALMWIYGKRHGVRRWQQLFIVVVSSVFGLITLLENMMEWNGTAYTILKILFVVISNVSVCMFCFKYCYERPSGLQVHQWIPNPLRSGDKVLRDEDGVYQPLQSKKVLVAMLLFFTFMWSLCPLIASNYSLTICILRIAEGQLAIYLIFYMAHKIRFERRTFNRRYIAHMVFLFSALVVSVTFYQYMVVSKNPINPLPFVIRVRFSTVKKACYTPITLLLTRNSSMLSAVLPRIQTFRETSTKFLFLSDILCEVDHNKKSVFASNDTAQVAVSSGVAVNYTFSVHKIFDHNLKVNSLKTFAVTASEATFYKYRFPDGINRILVRIESENDVCGRITIREANCPVLDSEGQIILFNNHVHQTVSRKGFIQVTKAQFGEHIHIVFTVLPDDDLCRTKNYYPQIADTVRVKEYSVLITPIENPVESILAIAIVFLIILAIIIALAWIGNRGGDNNQNPIERENAFWEMSISQFCIFIPLALCIVLAKYANIGFPTDTDTCNFNFLCSVNFLGLISANSVMSATSIVAAGIANFVFSWSRRWPENFTLNVYIILTGVLWAVMNTCPQTDTFHLYTFAMMILVLQGKFLQFGIRNGMQLWYQTYIGLYTMSSMLIIINDSLTDTEHWYWLCRIGVALNSFVFTIYFLWRYWKQLTPIEVDQTVPLINPQPVTIFMHKWNHDTSLPINRTFQAVYSISALIVVAFWTIAVPCLNPDFNSTLGVLRMMQSDFMLYFVYYCANKYKYETNLLALKRFFCLTIAFLISIAFWGWISADALPAFVPFSPAESRNLNTECLLSDIIGIDWHDILQLLTAIICVLFPAMMSCIDMNLLEHDSVTLF